MLGVGRWVLYRAATTRSPDGILCRASLDIVLKHPSSWRRDPWGFIFGRWVFGRWVFGRWVLGVGCWALGVGRWVRGRVTPGGRVDDEVTLPGLRWPVWKPRSRASRRYSRRRCECPAGLAIAERWVFGRWVLGVGCWALGVGCWLCGRVTPGGSSRRRGHFTGVSMAGLEAPVEDITAV